jgi:hypothetical protein
MGLECLKPKAKIRGGTGGCLCLCRFDERQMAWFEASSKVSVDSMEGRADPEKASGAASKRVATSFFELGDLQ